MYTQCRLATAAVLMSATMSVLSAQNITSAHSGTVHYFEGAVSIDGQQIEARPAKFSMLKDNSVLATKQGRAEILLTPGVFLRVGENSSVKMLDSRLLSTRVEFLSGTAMVESDDPDVSVKDPAVTIVYKSYEIQPVKFGLFELFSEPSQLKVFKGQANVAADGNRVVVKDGHLLPFSAALLTEKFDSKDGDDLYLWTRDRGAYLSAANLSSAKTLAASGYNASLLPASRFGGNWYYNPYFSMYTYMPFYGDFGSPFGYRFISPYAVGYYYNPGGYYWYGGGASRNGGGAGQTVSSSSQVARFGVAANHPTLSTPLRGNVAGGTPPMRGGFDRGAPQFDMSQNAAMNTSPRSMDMGSSRGGLSAGAAMPAAPAASPSAGRSASAPSGGGPRGR